jgi:hypothetical protein
MYNGLVRAELTESKCTNSDDDREALVGRLRELGLRFLAPSDADVGDLSGLPVRELIARLVVHSDARLRFALIPLFILHPEWVLEVQSVLQQLTEPARSELQALYTAAVYLQRLWRTRLGFYLGDFEALPDLYSGVLGLPPASERHGKTGLYALAAWHASRSPYPFNRLASYNKMMDLLFEQLKTEAKRHEPTTTS